MKRNQTNSKNQPKQQIQIKSTNNEYYQQLANMIRRMPQFNIIYETSDEMTVILTEQKVQTMQELFPNIKMFDMGLFLSERKLKRFIGITKIVDRISKKKYNSEIINISAVLMNND